MKNNGKNIKAILTVENLVVSYYKKEILKGASLEVMPGEIVALIGTNGSGKSTLLKTIAGVLKPLDGKIRFNGNDITGLSPEAINKKGIGILLQGKAVFPSLTVEEHLKLAHTSTNTSKDYSVIEETQDHFPLLESLMTKRAGLLSGGERQILAVAMLFTQNKNLWLLDEPSGGLAPTMVSEVMTKIKNTSKTKGISMLLVEQSLKEALNIADKVYILKNGKASLE
jgi:branched-chain amino acid transport system ATP-binding protein